MAYSRKTNKPTTILHINSPIKREPKIKCNNTYPHKQLSHRKIPQSTIEDRHVFIPRCKEGLNRLTEITQVNIRRPRQLLSLCAHVSEVLTIDTRGVLTVDTLC